LSLKSADLFLKNAYRCLKPGGVIRIVVPDLYKIAKKYIKEYDDIDSGNPTEFIMWAINMHREGQYGNPSLLKKIIYELQGYPHQHKFMYDDKSLIHKMEAYGFKDLTSLSYGNSNLIQEIEEVEGTKESYLSVYIEAIK
jgi:ubiquinone/menaquinone biosynthesis C-methylase UbiE